MILTALARYSAPDTIPFGYAAQPLGFTLVLDPDGQGIRLDSHAAFLLGLPRDEESAAKTAGNHSRFVDLMRSFFTQSANPVADAYLAWVITRPGLEEAVSQLSDVAQKRLHLDMISLAIADTPGRLHESVEAKTFWGSYVRASKSAKRKPGQDKVVCLACGNFGNAVATLPQSLRGRLVPGATKTSVALASVNFASAARGASGSGLKSAPICADCATKAVQSFNYLAASREHSWRSPTNDYGMSWWATDAATEEMAAVIFAAEPPPTVIKELLRWLRRGGEHGAFYLLAYSGNVARFVVRQWFELPATDLRASVAAWFQDCETPNARHPHLSVQAYASSLGVLRWDKGQPLQTPPHGAVEALVRTALTGTPVPGNYLALALAGAEVRLTRAGDGLAAHIARRRMDARVGVIRLILNRQHPKEKHMPAHLDESRDDPAYVAGRLFAVRESLQAWALGDVNASIVDKYFERASANPASVAQPLAVLTQQHLGGIKRKSGVGAMVSASERITALNDLQGDAPGRLDAAGQAAWLCGYHQQRMHDIENARARKAAKSKTSTGPDDQTTNND